jgi:SAM-dependent methyltransferase
MHPSAMLNAKCFFDTYCPYVPKTNDQKRIVEIGSQDVNGNIKQFAPSDFDYCGVDFVAGRGVDVVLDDPYYLPFKDSSTDIVVSSSCFEHSEMFWLLFLEIMRVLKPTGIFYLNAPSNGEFHRWPVDCWRFYPDAGGALVRWGQRNKIEVALLESYTSSQLGDQWNDFVSVYIKNQNFIENYPNRIVYTKQDIKNALTNNSDNFINFSVMPEDQMNK